MKKKSPVGGLTPFDFFLDALAGVSLFNNYYGDLLKQSYSDKISTSKGVEILVKRGNMMHSTSEGSIRLVSRHNEKAA